MQRPNEDPVSKDDVPWWMKYAGRGLGTVGGGRKFLSLFNLYNTFSLSIDSSYLFLFVARNFV